MSPPATPQWLWRALETPLGTLWLAASEAGLAGAWFAGQRHEPAIEEHQRRAMPTWAQGPAGSAAHAALERASAQLQRYFVDPSVSFDLPLDPSRGTGFQQAVWQALRGIPAGATLSYAALAEQVGRPRAVRAVGAAVGRNPWSVIVPCHRVLGSDGTLTGYAGGLDRKQTLLQWERAGNPAARRRAGGTATRTQAVAA